MMFWILEGLWPLFFQRSKTMSFDHKATYVTIYTQTHTIFSLQVCDFSTVGYTHTHTHQVEGTKICALRVLFSYFVKISNNWKYFFSVLSWVAANLNICNYKIPGLIRNQPLTSFHSNVTIPKFLRLGSKNRTDKQDEGWNEGNCLLDKMEVFTLEYFFILFFWSAADILFTNVFLKFFEQIKSV